MGFMKLFTQQCDVYVVEHGHTDLLPLDVCGPIDELADAPDGTTLDLDDVPPERREEILDQIAGYCDAPSTWRDRFSEITVRRNKWIARYSAPGYLDCTDWTSPCDTEEQAIAECKQMYGDDDEEEEGDTPTEPEEGDYVTTDYVNWREHGTGKLLLFTFGEEIKGTASDWPALVKAHMDAEKFWPNAWHLGERGDWNLLDLETGGYAK